jgi:hypothetical protein
MQIGIDEHTAAVFARPFLERQGDQIAEAAFGQRVLVGKQTMIAAATFHARLLADPGPPLVGAGWRTARLAGRLAFPPDRENVGTPAKQAPE